MKDCWRGDVHYVGFPSARARRRARLLDFLACARAVLDGLDDQDCGAASGSIFHVRTACPLIIIYSCTVRVCAHPRSKTEGNGRVCSCSSPFPRLLLGRPDHRLSTSPHLLRPSDSTATMGRMHAHFMGLSGPGLRFAIGLTAGLCFIAFGYGQGDVGGLLIMGSFRDEFPGMDATGNPGVYRYALMAGTVIGSWNLGCFVGAMLTIVFGDRLGRRGSALLGLGLEVVGKLIQTSTFSMGQYIAGRVIAGIGNGFVKYTWSRACPC